MDHSHDFPHTRVRCWATHQMAGTRRSATPQMSDCFEALQKPLPCLGELQPTAVAQPVARWDMTPFDRFGRCAACAVQPSSDVSGAWARGRHRLDVRLMAIGDHFLRDHPSASDCLAEERLRAGRVTVLTEQDIDDHTVLVDRTVEVAFLSFAEQEYLVHDPALADRASTMSDLGSQPRPEYLDPVEHGPMRDVEPRSASSSRT